MAIVKRTFTPEDLKVIKGGATKVAPRMQSLKEYLEVYGNDYAAAGLAWIMDAYSIPDVPMATEIVRRYLESIDGAEYIARDGSKATGFKTYLFKAERSARAAMCAAREGKPFTFTGAWYGVASALYADMVKGTEPIADIIAKGKPAGKSKAGKP